MTVENRQKSKAKKIKIVWVTMPSLIEQHGEQVFIIVISNNFRIICLCLQDEQQL